MDRAVFYGDVAYKPVVLSSKKTVLQFFRKSFSFSENFSKFSTETVQNANLFMLNDLYDTICITHDRFSDFHCVSTLAQQVVHTEFIKVVRTEYSAFKSWSKMSQEKVAAAVIIALISDKNKSKKKETKKEK